MDKKYRADDIVKSCPKLESGLRFGPEGIRACQLGPFAAPLYWTEEEAASLEVTKPMIVQKRMELFDQLNDPASDVICKKCNMVELKKFSEVNFTQLGRIDHAPRTVCNLRCNFCGFTQAELQGDTQNGFKESLYDSLKFLKVFDKSDVQWDAAVDFNGGETSLIKNLPQYMDYFREMKINILCFSNAVKFSEPLARALEEGVIQWLVVSIDAGTPSTYATTKKLDAYSKVLENVTKYAALGAGKSNGLAVKYIFTEDNCSDDDVYGFVYAMLAVRPQKVWLTFDFTPFGEIPPDSEDFLHYDFSRQIKAYAKMYLAFRKHGLEPVHYTEGHLAKISKAGKRLLREALSEINRSSLKLEKPDPYRARMLIPDFREVTAGAAQQHDTGAHEIVAFTDPAELEAALRSRLPQGARVAIAPAIPAAVQVARQLAPDMQVSLHDQNPNLHGRRVDGLAISDYPSLHEEAPQAAIVISSMQHRKAIVANIRKFAGADVRVLVCAEKGP